IIGSCLSSAYHQSFARRRPDVRFDHILFENVAELPRPPQPLDAYDFQYIQLSLRTVVSDGLIRYTRMTDPDSAAQIYGEACKRIDRMLDAALKYNKQTGILSFVSTFIVPQTRPAPSLHDQYEASDIAFVVERLNAYLAKSVRRYGNVYLADINVIANSMGKRFFLDDPFYFYSHNSVFYPDWTGHEMSPEWTHPEPGRIEPVPPIAQTYENRLDEFFEAVLRQLEAQYRTARQIDQVKAVIFDLDNTLWRGQLAEHYRPGRKWPYSDGWPLGLWEAVHHLKARGILVAICSRNDHETVAAMWSNAVNPPFLDLDDFAVARINWEPKESNVAEILREFALTPRSAVFVDDNPVERAAVEAALPGIRTTGSDPFEVRRILLWAPETQVPTLTPESRQRDEAVRKQIAREAERSAMSREEFLASLGCEATLVPVTDPEQPEFGRCLELINKTNQFNTTGRRWSAADFAGFVTKRGQVAAFRVKDRFADYGLVGVVLMKGPRIVQFVMSCRVIGLGIEAAVLGAIVEQVRKARPGVALHAQFRKTDANDPCRALYPAAGFTPSQMAEGGYDLAPETSPPAVQHVTIRVTGTTPVAR
ncbi:MAG: HAD-IIIC family phosphatase, partial [Bradyrhizobium sp.]|uniref:HAD-IIIC family phosphatase n=1 Tax=Bradyrhizobium sp. TaxID=376 RepID=UPI0025C007D5